MGKKIVISFPGGRGYEIPVLYFGAKYYEDQGYEKIFIRHPKYEECEFDVLLDNADKIISQIDFSEYDEILFTPLNETLPYIHSKNDIKLVAVGDKDRYIDVKMLQKVCDSEGVLCHIEQDVGHRMEVLNDLNKNLDIISNVIKRLN